MSVINELILCTIPSHFSSLHAQLRIPEAFLVHTGRYFSFILTRCPSHLVRLRSDPFPGDWASRSQTGNPGKPHVSVILFFRSLPTAGDQRCPLLWGAGSHPPSFPANDHSHVFGGSDSAPETPIPRPPKPDMSELNPFFSHWKVRLLLWTWINLRLQSKTWSCYFSWC